MSHPSTYMVGSGRTEDACRNTDGAQLTGLVDNSTQTSSYGSIPNDRSSYISINERTPLLGRRPTHQRSGINVGVLALGVLLIGGATIGTYLLIIEDRPYQTSYPFDLVYRESWNAADNINRGKKINSSLTQNVYIGHTGGRPCYKLEECVRIVKNLQNDSMYSSGEDLPYNFLIGGDGKTYEGRGWNYEMGIESYIIDPSTSFLIGLIGNYTHTTPETKQIEEIKSLLDVTQRRNKLWKNYNVYVLRNMSVSLVDGLGLISVLQKKFENFRYIIDIT